MLKQICTTAQVKEDHKCPFCLVPSTYIQLPNHIKKCLLFKESVFKSSQIIVLDEEIDSPWSLEVHK
jgi:hypothetical protein